MDPEELLRRPEAGEEPPQRQFIPLARIVAEAIADHERRYHKRRD